MAALKIALTVDASNPTIGDLYIGSDGTDRLTSTLVEEVAQMLFTRFRMFKGEWFPDPTVGVPYFQSILGQKQSSQVIASIFRAVITTCPGVASLTQFNATAVGRVFSLTFACTLTDGTTLRSGNFGAFALPVAA